MKDSWDKVSQSLLGLVLLALLSLFRVEVAASPPFFIGEMLESGILVIRYQS